MVRAVLLAVLMGFSSGSVAADESADAAKTPAADASASAPAKPAADADAPQEPAKAEERILKVEKSNAPPKCEIKPVMTDDELRACGARIGK